MNDTPDDDGTTYELVMPFVVVTSKGGPYDDAAWVAGCEFGSIDRLLSTLPPEVREFSVTVTTGNLPQYDLAAMRHGWILHSQPWADNPDDWTFATFLRQLDGPT